MLQITQGRLLKSTIELGFFIALLCIVGCVGSNKGSSGASSSVSSSAPVVIAPNDPGIRYTGRVALSSEAALYDWANTQIEFQVSAPLLEVMFDDGKNDYNLFVDGTMQGMIQTLVDKRSYSIDLTPGEHHIRITKRTGPNFGSGQFLGLHLPLGGTLLSLPAAPSRKIEFIGDSYTVGYGNEGPGLDCGGTYRPYENSYQSFAPISARALGAQSHSIAISGFGAVRNYDDPNMVSTTPMPLHYSRTLMERSDLAWDFSAWIPDAVVIKLGANDHSTQPEPSEEVFIQGVHGLIAQVNSAYGELPIFLLVDSSLSQLVSRMQSVTRQQHDSGNIQVHFVQVTHPQQSQLGCDWHPMVEGHESMAAELVEAMRPILGWHNEINGRTSG